MKNVVMVLCLLLCAGIAGAGKKKIHNNAFNDDERQSASPGIDSHTMLTTEDLDKRYGAAPDDEANAESGNPLAYLSSHKEDIIRNWLSTSFFPHKPGVESQQLSCKAVQAVVLQNENGDKARVTCGFRASGYSAPGKCCSRVTGEVTLYYYSQEDIRIEATIQ